ncbi:MAG: hypothetical protein NTW00_09315, partial [Hyphomicrobiales bacterium]|nr:hypothetical protein [Hyphomicrobiales bacterium]
IDRDEWLSFLTTCRTICLAPGADFERVLDDVCKLWRRVMADPSVQGAGNSDLPPGLWPDGLVVADAFQPSLHAAGRFRLIQKRDMPAVRFCDIKHVRTASPHFPPGADKAKVLFLYFGLFFSVFNRLLAGR